MLQSIPKPISKTVQLELSRSVGKLRHVENTIRLLPTYVWEPNEEELQGIMSALEAVEERILKFGDEA